MPSLSPPSNRCRLAITVRGVVQGVGFRPFVYHAARRHDWPAGCRTSRARCTSRPKATGPPWSSLSTPCAMPTPLKLASMRSRSGRSPARRSPQRPFRQPPLQSAAALPSGAAADNSRRPGHLRPLPGRDRRPGPAPLSLSVYQLHQLRPAIVDHSPTPLRPPADFDGRFSRSARSAGRNTRSGRPALPCPANSLSAVRPDPAIARCPREENRHRGDRPGLGCPGRAGGSHRGRQGPGRISTPGRRNQCRRGEAAAAEKAASRPALRPDVPLAGRSPPAL